MKKVRKALNNKNGFSYIPVCIFTLIVVMVIGILMQYRSSLRCSQADDAKNPDYRIAGGIYAVQSSGGMP